MRVGMLGAGFSLAVAAGFFAAMASVFSKLAFEDGGSTLKHITCVHKCKQCSQPHSTGKLRVVCPQVDPVALS